MTIQDNKNDEARDLKNALAIFKAKDALFTDRYAYYDGDHRIKYSTERLRKAFEKIDVFFAENWCGVIVNAVLERIGLQGWTTEDAGLQTKLRDLWSAMAIQRDSADVSEAAIVCGEGYIIADRPDKELNLFYNDPRMSHLFYETSNPKKKRAGVKIWKRDDGRYELCLYYPDRISAYTSIKEGKFPADGRDMEPDTQRSGPNDFQEVPVFHFRLHRRKVVGDLTRDICSLQDAENKLVADLMASSEFNTFPERIYITAQKIANLKRSPGMKTRLAPAPKDVQPVSVEELGGSGLQQFIPPLERFANSMAVISRTPRHYFFSTGGNVSGDALIAMEAPLVAKAETYRESLGETWQEIGAFVARENGMAIPLSAIQPSWKPSATVQPVARATEIQSLVAAGMGLESACRVAGLGEDEIQKIMKEKQGVDNQLAADAKAALDAARNTPLPADVQPVDAGKKVTNANSTG